jgi:hypothetical protein
MHGSGLGLPAWVAPRPGMTPPENSRKRHPPQTLARGE